MERPGSLDDLAAVGAHPEQLVRLANARVAAADYERLFADFPHLAMGDEGTRKAAADEWLLSAAGVSLVQAGQSEVNTPIGVRHGELLDAVRLPRQGRSAFVRMPAGHKQGVLSVKGVGVAPPSRPERKPQANGLIPLYCALYEFAMHRLVAAAFKHARAPHTVLPAYAVIDAGFDEFELNRDAGQAAGLLVRAAHYRPLSDLPKYGSQMQRAVAEAEFVLRRFGISSSNTSPWVTLERTDGEIVLTRTNRVDRTLTTERLATLHEGLGGGGVLAFDAINLQYTESFDRASGAIELIDMHYAVKPSFDLPVVSTVCDRELGWGGVLDVEDPLFVQPEPALLAAMDVWVQRAPDTAECLALGVSGEVQDGGIFACLEAVRAFRHGERAGAMHILDLVDQAAARWP